MIVVDGVTKSYGSTVVVDDVSLVLPRGGVTAVIGPNGAGKSTLLSIIGRLLESDHGTVTVDGMDVASTPSRDLARRLAILRQDTHLSVRVTVRQLVAFGRFPPSQGRLSAEDDEAVDEAVAFLESCGIKPFGSSDCHGNSRSPARSRRKSGAHIISSMMQTCNEMARCSECLAVIIPITEPPMMEPR